MKKNKIAFAVMVFAVNFLPLAHASDLTFYLDRATCARESVDIPNKLAAFEAAHDLGAGSLYAEVGTHTPPANSGCTAPHPCSPQPTFCKADFTSNTSQYVFKVLESAPCTNLVGDCMDVQKQFEQNSSVVVSRVVQDSNIFTGTTLYVRAVSVDTAE